MLLLRIGLGLGLGSDYSFIGLEYRLVVQGQLENGLSHVTVECRVINHHPHKMECGKNKRPRCLAK